uniref:Reverse transcriptase domain-containing protein n=1 Tax=Tanacetum cinerariifolium TaxID=118510 RepID=A0A6L2N6E7_TANCI|nr:reverse transcriptase domain-containing protein [Tanacetum cinerariifolium]
MYSDGDKALSTSTDLCVDKRMTIATYELIVVRKFLRALPTKWHPKVTGIEESKDLSMLLLDELIGNLKFYEVVLEKDSEASKIRDFKKFFRRKGKFVRQLHDDKKSFRKLKEEKKGKEERRCFKCGDPNHFISDCPKHSYNDQNAFGGGCWSDSEEDDDSKKDEICLMAHDSNEKFSLQDFKPIKKPMSSETKLTWDEDEESVENTKYRGMIESLLYLTASRSDIMFSVCLCARFQEDHKSSHLEASKGFLDTLGEAMSITKVQAVCAPSWDVASHRSSPRNKLPSPFPPLNPNTYPQSPLKRPEKKRNLNTSAKRAHVRPYKYSGEADMSKDTSGSKSPEELRRGWRNYKRPYEEERFSLTEKLIFSAIPQNSLMDEPIILEGMIEGRTEMRSLGAVGSTIHTMIKLVVTMETSKESLNNPGHRPNKEPMLPEKERGEGQLEKYNTQNESIMQHSSKWQAVIGKCKWTTQVSTETAPRENSPIRMAKDDKEKIGFHTEEGVYCFTHMPKGLKNSTATLQRMVEKVLADQKGQNVEVYLEEIVMKSKDEQSLIEDVEETLNKLKWVNMKNDPNESTFRMKEGRFLGYTVTEDGIRPNPEKIQAVMKSHTPRGLVYV